MSDVLYQEGAIHSLNKSDVVVQVRDLSFSYAQKPVLTNVSFDLVRGRVTMLIGANGAGKTTLFSLLTRLLPLENGTIEYAGLGSPATTPRILAQMGIVFQSQTLDLDLTVGQNLAYFGALQGMTKANTLARALPLLSAMQMDQRLDEKVRNLNGGHRRRVEIARALLSQPAILLLDEPTVGLDMPTRRALVSYIHRLAHEQKIAVLWATHLADEVQDDDKVVLLSAGVIAAQGSLQSVLKQFSAQSLDGVLDKALTQKVLE